MRFLLDTHALIWFDSNPELLSQKVLDILIQKENIVFISDVTLWEMQIKKQLGKLSLETELQALITAQKEQNGFKTLPIKSSHIYALDKLPQQHRDPFDRLLISQAISEELTLLTTDVKIQQYPLLEWLW